MKFKMIISFPIFFGSMLVGVCSFILSIIYKIFPQIPFHVIWIIYSILLGVIWVCIAVFIMFAVMGELERRERIEKGEKL